jgi:hypothetical protein
LAPPDVPCLIALIVIWTTTSSALRAPALTLLGRCAYAPLLHWAPVACWSVAGAGLLVLAASHVQRCVQGAQAV